MLFEKYDPLKKKQFSVLNLNGELVHKDFHIDMDKESLIHLYKIMFLSRTLDIKALQFQRQGRILTYVPNRGQEATQVASVAALESTDWVVPSFRELGAWLYKGISIEQILLYFYGNEKGSQIPKGIKILPINIIIASQLNHAVGIAMASDYRQLKEVVLGFVGDGGTSSGEFHEALNFASVFKAPVVFLIQNNQWAISVPRKNQTHSETLAQKGIAYGIPSIQVDGNDVFAVYYAVQEAAIRARNGEGPSVIECVTYRLGPHTSSDDPTLYRSNEEVDEWAKKDPILRFKQYLIKNELWDEDKEKNYEKEINTLITEAFKKVEASGVESLDEIFENHFEKLPQSLLKQVETYKEYLKEGEK